MTLNKYVYLAGHIQGLTYENATEWREYATKYLNERGIAASSPMRAKDYLKDQEDIAHHYNGHPLSTAKAITMRDRYDVKNCDLVLAYFNGNTRSMGTSIEFGWADAWGKPVIMVDAPDGEHANHGMLSTIAGIIVPTLDEGLDLAIAILDPHATSKVLRQQYELVS